MMKFIIKLGFLLFMIQGTWAQKSNSPLTVGSLCERDQTGGDPQISIIVGQALSGNYVTAAKCRLGFPFEAQYIQNTFAGGLQTSKGYYADYVLLQWNVVSNSTSITSFAIARRKLTADNSAQYMTVATIDPTSSSWQDLNCETSTMYEYKVTAVGVPGSQTEHKTFVTAVGFRQPIGVATGRITYAGGTAVSGVSVLAETKPSIPTSALLFNGTSSKITLDETTNGSLTSKKGFTFQAWINTYDTTDTSIVFEKAGLTSLILANDSSKFTFSYAGIGEVSLYASDINEKYIHVTAMKLDSTLRVVVNDGYTVMVASQTFATIGAESDASSFVIGDNFNGLMDEIRFWNIALDSTTIQQDFTRILSGTEEGLSAYFNCNENVGTKIYDRTHTGFEFVGNDAVMVDVEWSTNTPNHLGVKGITDNNGNYKIEGIPYAAQGSSYTFTPMLGVHKFNPTQALHYFSAGNNVSNNVDFMDNSSFVFKGVVYYDNTTFPVAGVNVLIDDQYAYKGRNLVETDANGEFTVDVPIGLHKITLSKQGHVFSKGEFPDASYPSRTFDFQEDMVQRVSFYDATTAVLAGRVVGGSVQGGKPLGFGLSNANLGYGKIVMKTVKKGISLSSTKTAKGLDSSFTFSQSIAINENNKNTTRYVVKDDQITIYPDTLTGEYALPLIPEQFVITSAVVGDLSNTSKQYSFPGTALGAFGLNINDKDSSSYLTQADNLLRTFRFNKRYDFVWSEKPSIEVTQDDKALFGEPLVVYTDDVRKIKDTILLYDAAGTYTFGKPIFKQQAQYSLKIKVYEEYKNLVTGVVQCIPVTKGNVLVTNDMSSERGELSDSLDGNGTVTYTFIGGEPNLVGDHALSMNVKCVYSQGSDSATHSITWGNGMAGIVLGAQGTGDNFITSGPTRIITVLRDPSGSNSYSYLEKGSTLVTTNEVTGALLYNMETGLTTHLGAKSTVGAGLGFMVISEVNSVADINIGCKHSSKTINGNTLQTTTVTTERWETSSEPDYVGAMGDVFVGYSQNYVFGITKNLTIVPDTSKATGKKYVLGETQGFNMSSKFATSFKYTQNHITGYLIPNLEMLRNSLFITKPDIYIPKLSPSDPHYYINTKTVNQGDTLKVGDAYDFVIAKQLPKRVAGQVVNTEDSIAVYNRWIEEWKNILADNEKAKVEAIDKTKDVTNHSFDAGTVYESSVTTESTETRVDAYSGETYGYVGGDVGFTALGIGFTITTNHEIGGSYDVSSTKDTTRSITFGYVLSEQNAGDYLSVDVYKEKGGNGPIFRTRGGQTSCPHEDKIVAEYYKPEMKYVLSEATMKIESPEINVKVPYQVDVPSTQAAVFDVSLINKSEVGVPVWYNMKVVDDSNPFGAVITVDGVNIGSGRSFNIAGNGELVKKVTVAKGVSDQMKYENIKLVLQSQCQADPSADWSDISDTASVNVEFVPSCTSLSLASPVDKWNINTQTDTTLKIRVNDFNKNDGNFVGIYLEYKESSSSEWKSLSAFFPDTVSAAYKSYNGVKQTINGSDIQYAWDTRAFEDRTWDLRARSVCRDNVFAYSSVASGIKDTKCPQVFGTPRPSDGILSAGEDVMVRFSEPLESGLVGKGNIIVQGVLNGAKIDHSASLQLDGKASYAKADGFSFTGQPITVEFWMQRDPASKAGTIFAKGLNHERVEIATVNDSILEVTFDTTSYNVDLSAIFTPDKRATSWHHFAVVFDNITNNVLVYGDDKLLLDNKKVTFKPTERGPIFIGCSASNSSFVQANVQDVRVWNTARNVGDIYANMYTQLTGNEENLLAYWTLDEGKGTLVTDRASAHNLTLHAGWNIAPRGNAATFNGIDQALIIDGKSVVIDATHDATVEFWFKASKPATRACLLYNGLRDTVYNSSIPNSFGVMAETDGTLSLLTRGVTTTATTINVCDDQWHHCAVVLDRLSNIRTYIDGALQTQLDKSLLTSLAMPDLSIGAKRQVITSTISKTDMYFAGSIDEVRVWQTARRASLIDRYMNSKLDGKEQALVLYYPFETTDPVVGVVSSLKDKTKTSTSADAATIGTPAFTAETPAVKDACPLQTLDASVVVNGDQLLVELPSDLAPRYEKRTLEITAYNVQDKNGNKLASPAQWIAYVEKNPVVWDKPSVDVATTGGQAITFNALVVNKGGTAKTFVIDNLPSWLSASSQSGTVQPNSSLSITFTVIAGVNIGAYQHKISLSTDFGYDEVLEVNLTVKAQAPAWKVNSASYQYTMNLFGILSINGDYSLDDNDMVAAFVGEECRGVTSLKYLDKFDLTEAMLAIYSNNESGDSITFMVWDASEGKIYSHVTPSLSFAADAVKGSPANPIVLACDNTLLTEYNLNKGWNWLSVNVQNPVSNSVQSLFGTVGGEGDEIKGQRSVFDKFSTKAGWSGSLTEAGGLKPTDMYKMKLTKASTAKISGAPVESATCPVAIAAGWNWIGYVPQYNMTVDEALASYGPSEGDIIKSQKQFSMYYDRIGWMGTLGVMEPGKGYMLMSATASSLVYPRQSSLKSSVEVDDALSLKGYNASAFQSNMCIVASVSDKSVSTDGKLLVAYNGSTIVGATSATEGKYFLVAGGNGQQTLTFALVDTLSGTKTAFDNQLAYATDAVQGSVDAPYMLYSSSALDAGEHDKRGIQVTPSVFSNKLNVSGNNIETSTVAVRLLDVLGRELYATGIANASGSFSLSLDHIASVLAPGAYSVEVTVGGTKTVTKVVK